MKKIVIIDDEYFFRQALIKYVRSFKDEFTVVGDAGNGKLGIELIEQYHPEIILIDISMPQMTGFDVISYIQKQALQTRFIIISGYDKFEYAQKAIQMGVQDFLLKPVTVESLHKSLRQTSERIDQEVKKDQNLEVLDKKKAKLSKLYETFCSITVCKKR
ncbi:response regulator [Ruminococcus sp. D54t1_190329_F1]|uniref:response regulator n=1 Tax=Ruminococcus sp. D54t1_190329_F1 TaxID=2787114 RepID=UPI001897963B|nr:response regulator [Ruminococcus sp. D54t1_190329_F1]